MRIQLSDHFTFSKLIRFTFPSICTMIFISIYLVIDGYFVSNFVGKSALAAVNMTYPIIMIINAIGFMFGSGGSALVATTLGAGNENKARKLFTLMHIVPLVISLIITIPSYIFLPQILDFLGAEGQLLDDCIIYGRILLSTVVFGVFQAESQYFFITAERPKLGLLNTILACGSNIVLDGLFCAVFNLGIWGAAVATAISQAIGGIIPILYFTFAKNNKLHFTKVTMDWHAVQKSMSNGVSELITNISSSVVSMLFNAQLLKITGEDGIAAYCVLMYVNMVFFAIFFGFSSGTSSIVSYNYGAENYRELKGLFKKLINLILVSSVAMLILSFILAKPLSLIFVGYDEKLYQMTVHGFYIYSFSFLFAGINIFSSSFFTALNNGKVSAIISFLRTFFLQTISVLILPLFLGLDGVWLSMVVAEIIASFISVYYIISKKKVYRY